ncbi:MAG: TolC family protein, partial [Thermodesulfobacteria bacterium]|nr:TolC family protein [Thermodesulfobacteriota bacterium]
KQELIYNVTNVFNQILFLDDLIKAQEDTLDALKKLRADSKRRLDVGRLAPVDLLRIDTQVAEQEYALVRSREQRVRAKEALAALLGTQDYQEIIAIGKLRKPETKAVVFARSKIEDLIRERPDLKSAERDVIKAEKTVRLEKGYHLPSINFIGDYGRRAGSGFEGNEEVWSAGISLELNIFSGGVISARVKEAEAKYLAAKNRYKHLQLNAFKEVVQALSAIKEAEKRLVAAESALRSARESYRIEELRYKTGAGSVTDSLLSHSAWLQARANVFQAIYDMDKAVMDYRLATGTVESENIVE